MNSEISIPFDLFSDLTDYALELRGEWGWKQNERAGNAKEYSQLHATAALALELRNKHTTFPNINTSKNTESNANKVGLCDVQPWRFGPWQCALNMTINVRHLGDGTYHAHCPQLETNAVGDTQGIAIARLLHFTGQEIKMRRLPILPQRGYFDQPRMNTKEHEGKELQ